MLIKPTIADDTIISCLYNYFGLHITQVAFLPIGYVNSAVYRLTTDNGIHYFLKLRQVDFSEIAVTVPAFLHARGILQVIAPPLTITHML